ncbi:MAG: FUSC family protein, partial [Sphingobacteriales bacterium]|nr:FUSC family protein [Sphingobacteriales bacterium]
ANSVGVAALIIMVLTLKLQHTGWDIFYNSFYVMAGGVWYMVMSLVLYRVRPYKMAQQVLGDCILATSNYLRTRASFYDNHVNYEKSYQHLFEQQILVQEKQNLVREILFKTRGIVRDSTNTGRVLMMIFQDSIDLFERTMTSYQDYEALHHSFESSDILSRYQHFILELSKELDDIGIAVKSGHISEESGQLQIHLKELQAYFNTYRDKYRTAGNVEAFISLRHILNSIEDIVNRIHTLHLYTTYDRKHTKKLPSVTEYEKFISHTVIDEKLLKDNLSLSSNTFRHAIRISIATLCGYLASILLPVGHSYWILLTIIVILKPAYSLTKKRNYQRLLGTITGAIIGLAILYFINDHTILFIIMIVLMIGTFSLIRTNYMASVFMMTPYIMVLFHLLNRGDTQSILYDRVVDTAIGSIIAFLANFFLVPSWEKDQIKNYMVKALNDNANYFKKISCAYVGKPYTVTQYKLSRKAAFVSLANLSDAFARMLSEPKHKQQNNKLIHQYVVLNHMLTSHIATLSYYATPLAEKYSSDDFLPVIKNTVAAFEKAISILKKSEDTVLKPLDGQANATVINEDAKRNNILNDRINELIRERKAELQNNLSETDIRKTLSEFKAIVDQFNFISQIAGDINKISTEFIAAKQ